jgi:hypothetical protein
MQFPGFRLADASIPPGLSVWDKTRISECQDVCATYICKASTYTPTTMTAEALRGLEADRFKTAIDAMAIGSSRVRQHHMTLISSGVLDGYNAL